MGPENLYLYLCRAKVIFYGQRVIPLKEMVIFRRLSEGHSVSRVGRLVGLNEKQIYFIRQKAKDMLNLRGNNAVMTLLCWDVMRLGNKKIHIEKKHNNTFMV